MDGFYHAFKLKPFDQSIPTQKSPVLSACPTFDALFLDLSSLLRFLF